MNILLIGHACGPGMGSEPGYTWNWAHHLSRQHQVWVIAHPQHRSKVEAWLLENPNPNIRFVWVNVKSVLDPWKPERGEQGIGIHYLLWLKTAYATAQKLCKEIAVDVAHHVSWGTLRAAPPLWRLPVPSVWGPIGGGQCTPFAFLRYFGWRAGQEVLRTVSVKTRYFSPGLRKAALSSALIFATNKETQGMLKRIARAKVRLLLDCGLPSVWVSPDPPPADRSSREFTLLWAGRLEHRKALTLALQALSRIRHIGARLVIAGTGALRPKLEAIASDLGVASRVRFLGSVPHGSMQALFQSADAFLFTSLRDSFGSVVLEAMAHGLPIVTLDHQGVGTFVPDDAGIKVPVTYPRETVQSLASAIEKLVESPTLLRSMQLAGWSFAKAQTWDLRAQRMTKIYEEVTSGRRERPMENESLATPAHVNF